MPIYRNTPVSERRAPLNLQYPVESYSDEAPFVVFRQIEAKYDTETRYQQSSNDPFGIAGVFGRVGNSGLVPNSPIVPTGFGEAVERIVDGNINAASNVTRNYFSRDNTRVTRQFSIPTDDVVSMYIPLGFSIDDSFGWEMDSSGLLGKLAESTLQGQLLSDLKGATNNITSGKLSNPDASALVTAHGDKAFAAASGVAASVLGKAKLTSFLSSSVAALAGFGIGDALFKEVRKRTQSTLNPRQFMLFNGPNIRKFSLDFNFLPVSETESTMVQNIIQWFREAAYPELSPTGISYVFPAAFLIEFSNINNSIPKIPEVVLETVSTQYNPTSMSYFYVDGRPVEVHLRLSFSELQPIHKEMVINGY